MRNNLLSGTVGGLVGTTLNTPYVFHPLIRTMSEFVRSHGGRFIRSCADLMLSSRESKARQEFRGSLRNIIGHTQRKCQFLGRAEPLLLPSAYQPKYFFQAGDDHEGRGSRRSLQGVRSQSPPACPRRRSSSARRRVYSRSIPKEFVCPIPLS